MSKAKLDSKKATVQKVFVNGKPAKPEKRDFIFDHFEVIYYLGYEKDNFTSKQVGKYKCSPSTRLFGDGKTAERQLTWSEREDLDHEIAELIENKRTRYVKRKKK